MTPSIFIARILGPVLLIIGIGLLLEGDSFRAMAGEFLRDQGLIYVTGILTLVCAIGVWLIQNRDLLPQTDEVSASRGAAFRRLFQGEKP